MLNSLIVGVFTFLMILPVASGNSETLAQVWEKEIRSPLRGVKQETFDTLKNKHVVFVPGVMHEYAELINSYYFSNIKAVERDFGMSSYYVKDLYSKNSIEKNAEKLHDIVLSEFNRVNTPLDPKRAKRKIVIVGHSKGGAETLYLILKYPQLILTGIVDRVVLIQAALGGSPLVNHDEEASLLFRSLYSLRYKNGLHSLKPSVAEDLFEKAYADYLSLMGKRYQKRPVEIMEERLKKVSNRIFYVRSYEDPSLWGKGLKLTLTILGKTLAAIGLSDGLVLLNDQKFDRIGIDLGVVKADHLGLTISSMNRLSNADREAFTRAAFRAAFGDFVCKMEEFTDTVSASAPAIPLVEVY